MPHQTRLVELLIASPEVGIIIFSPNLWKLLTAVTKTWTIWLKFVFIFPRSLTFQKRTNHHLAKRRSRYVLWIFSAGLTRSRVLTLQDMFWFIVKSIPVRIGILKCWFLEERGKPQNPKKSLLKQVGRTSFLGPGRRVFPPPVFVFLRRRPNAVIMTGPATGSPSTRQRTYNKLNPHSWFAWIIISLIADVTGVSSATIPEIIARHSCASLDPPWSVYLTIIPRARRALSQ